MLLLHLSNSKCIHTLWGFDAYLPDGSLSRTVRSYYFAADSTAKVWRKLGIWGEEVMYQVYSVWSGTSDFVDTLYHWAWILKAQSLQDYSCACTSEQGNVTYMYKTQKHSFRTTHIFIREDCIILPTIDLISFCVGKVKWLKYFFFLPWCWEFLHLFEPYSMLQQH